jgi:hypothetical protein
MAWIIPAEADVLTVLSETELATYRAAALASGQSDPLAPTLAQVVDLVRGLCGRVSTEHTGFAGDDSAEVVGAGARCCCGEVAATGGGFAEGCAAGGGGFGCAVAGAGGGWRI